ncbi:unnamed protein product [Rotaria socialis]|uniref:Uncharacterized protein n=1 Tax=Rotaria socialis TaxID=392032 RepID=A0A817QN81_9BILA|nr:unnamed protein product [Rotaria socialis]
MFQIDLVHSEHQERYTEEIILSRTDYLDRAENIQLMDRIEVIVSDALNFSNEQGRPQALEVPGDETNNRPVEPQPALESQEQATNQMSEVAAAYRNNTAEFDRKALNMVRRHGLPRT